MAERRRPSRPREPSIRSAPEPVVTTTDDPGAASQVQEVVDQLRSDFAERDTLYERTDAVLWGNYKLNVPDAYRTTTVETRSPLQQNIASTIAAALSVNQAQVSFEPVGRGQAAQLNAEARQHFFEASWRRQESESRRQLLRLFLWSLVTKGEGVLKTVERTKRAWAGYAQYSKRLEERLDDPSDGEYGALARTGDEGRKRQAYDEGTEAYKMGKPYPIATTDVEPDSFYYYLTPDGYRLCAEVVDVPYLDALDRFGAGLDGNGRVTAPVKGLKPGDAYGLPRPEWIRAMGGLGDPDPHGAVGPGVLHVCPERARADVQSAAGRGLGRGTVVKRVKHGYGDPWTRTLKGPYFHALGITTASRLPERAGLSVLYPFLSLFPALDSYLTIQSNAAYLTGYPTFKRTQPPGGSLAASLGQVAGPQVAPFGLDGSERDALASQTTKLEPGTIYPWDVAPIEMPRSRHRDRQGHRRHHGLPRAGPPRLRPGRLRRGRQRVRHQPEDLPGPPGLGPHRLQRPVRLERAGGVRVLADRAQDRREGLRLHGHRPRRGAPGQPVPARRVAGGGPGGAEGRPPLHGDARPGDAGQQDARNPLPRGDGQGRVRVARPWPSRPWGATPARSSAS